MYVTTIMVVLLIAWSGLTILRRPEAQRLPPAPVVSNLVFTDDAVGWMPRLIPHSLRGVAAEGSPALSETASSAAKEPPHFAFVPNAGMLLGLIGILMAFGHSFLAMSGEESLAQVNRELEYPKHAEPDEGGDGDLRLLPALHLARLVLRLRAHPGRGAAAVLQQPDQRHRDATWPARCR